MKSELFVNQLLKWYDRQKRELPWRNTKNPYLIWLSEIILQQTRIIQGLPYYQRFVETYPTVQDLANADESEVLRLWQGLGYYSRARNLHNCAKIVANELNGEFPTTYNELLKLKGVGKYTAAAIASFAFDAPHAVVDGNVFRVLSRVFGIIDDISDARSFQVFEKKANSLIPQNNAAEFNQAIMDFGAIQCTPKKPACALCPFSLNCFAFNKGMIEQLPVKTKKVKVKKLYFNYLVIEGNEQFLLKERGAKNIWQGLYDFPLIESAKSLSEEEILSQLDQREDMMLEGVSSEVKHVLTHRQIFARFYKLKVKDLDTFEQLGRAFESKPYSIDEINALPKPILIQNYLKEEVF